MYFAKDDKVYYCHHKLEDAELYLTVHKEGSFFGPEAAAKQLAEMLNKEMP